MTHKKGHDVDAWWSSLWLRLLARELEALVILDEASHCAPVRCFCGHAFTCWNSGPLLSKHY